MRRPVFDPSWPDDVAEIYRNDMREIWDPSIERHMFNAYHNTLDLYRGLVDRYEAHSILDVGCAQATSAILLAEAGKQVTAVDIRESFLNYAKTRYERGDIRFIASNVFDATSPGEFDLVFANQIIEHLVYPADFRSSLPSYTELGDPKGHEHRQFSSGGEGHFFAYTEEELRTAAGDAGLDVVEVLYFESPWISGHFFFRFIHPLTPVAALRAADRAALRIAPRKLAHQICMVLRRRR